MATKDIAESFFDKFGPRNDSAKEDVAAPEEVLWDKEDHEAFNKLLLNEEGRSMQELQRLLKELVEELLAVRDATLEEALDAIGEEPYVAATVDPAAFEQLVKEAGMAAH